MATIEAITTETPQLTNPFTIPRGPTVGTLNFFAPPSPPSTPFAYPNTPPPSHPKRNFGDRPLAVPITDIRNQESLYTLQTHGFQPLSHVPSSPLIDFSDEESIKESYYPEVESLLLNNVCGATRVCVFDHTVRPSGGSRPPVQRVHIDQTPTAAIGRLRASLPNEADTLLENRVRIVNVWRALNGSVERDPLAFAESGSVRDEQLVKVEHRYADRVGETYSVTRGGEKWFYWSGVGEGERILLQLWDSEGGGRCPHSAFEDGRGEGGRVRESVEVRALVFG